MSCNFPILAYRKIPDGTDTMQTLSFNPRHAGNGSLETVRVKCGRCLGCREAKSKEWALRCVHESQLYGHHNCFITLTLNSYFIPKGGTLDHKLWTRFMSRFRKTYKGHFGVIDENGTGTFPIRYYHVGEYGGKYGRPHHHACIFNFRFDDLVLFKHDKKTGVKIYLSEKLMDLWSVRIKTKDSYKYPAELLWLDDNNRLHARLGNCTVGEVNFQSAAYLARYMCKKGDKKTDAKRLTDIDLDTGELIEKIPEYQTMSLKPGIGADWFAANHADCFPKDFTTHAGKKYKIPSYYEKIYDITNSEKLEQLKKERTINAVKHRKSETELKQRELNMKAKHKRLTRRFENAT